MKNKARLWQILCLNISLVFSGVVMADDAEIYYEQSLSANPNVLFLLDTSGSMNAELPNSGGKTRLQVMQEVLGDVLTGAPPNLNVGLMRYGGHSENAANGVSFPTKAIDAEALPIVQAAIDPSQDNLPDPDAGATVRQFLASVGASWNAQGYTPIVDALYEASLYFRGNAVDFGNVSPTQVRAAHPATYTTQDCAGTYTQSCNKTAGECSGPIVAGSCSTQQQTNCTQWEQQTKTVNGQCCGWSQETVTGQCCQYVASGYDEAGNATGWVCKDNNYSCSTNTSVCTNNDWSCTGTVTESVCVKEVTNSVEYCQQELCYSAKQYTSPMQYECQANYIVLMSDGRPEYSGGTETYPQRKSTIESAIGTTCADGPSGYKSGTCGPEVTKFLAENDQSSTVDGKQTVETFTVAFALDDANGTDYLKSLATAGGGTVAANTRDELKQAFAGIMRKASHQATQMEQLPVVATAAYGANQPQLAVLQENFLANMARSQDDPLVTAWGMWQGITQRRDFAEQLTALFKPDYTQSFAATGGFFSADNVQGLTDAFNSILQKIDASASSFSAPTYTVDKNTLLSHADEVFIPVFERSLLPLWSGNLKKFKLKDEQIMGKAADGSDKAAVSSDGTFLDDAWDYWGSAVSGKAVQEGGAASLLDPSKRVLYTDAVELTLSALDKTNTNISKTLLGDASMTDAYREQLLDFARGYKSDGTARKHMGDIMNSRPVVMDYGSKSYVLVGTNEGFLHAFDTESGAEKWAFMPSVLLKNIATFYANSQPKQHVYGIDGRLTLDITDANHDGLIQASDGDTAHLYFGMRRGGRAYYALDITDVDSPKLLWKVDHTVAGFSELGESWSTPALAAMRIYDVATSQTTLKDVLVFGAGFDPAKEEADPSKRAADSMGRDVFIIDALTGQKIWSLRTDVTGANSQLHDSVTGDIRVMDMDRNGALDRLYFADTGGTVWRVDMDMDVRDADSSLYDYTNAKLTHFASLGGSGEDKRKFYYEPDVALMQQAGGAVMTLAIGSGYRSHPQSSNIVDRFYVLLDENVYNPLPDTFATLQDIDITASDVLEASGETLLTGSHKGWLFDLPNEGEKVLASAVTVLNKVVFTTFASEKASSSDPCAPPPNKARAYVLDLYSGAAVANLDRSGDGSKDKSVVAGLNEILDSAQIIFNAPTASDGSACTASDCQQTIQIRVGKMNLPIMDAANSNNSGDNVAEKTDLSDILPRIFWNDRNISKE